VLGTALSFWKSYGSNVASACSAVNSLVSGTKTILQLCGVVESVDSTQQKMLEEMKTQFEGINTKLSAMQSDMNKGFESVKSKIDQLANTIKENQKELTALINRTYQSAEISSATTVWNTFYDNLKKLEDKTSSFTNAIESTLADKINAEEVTIYKDRRGNIVVPISDGSTRANNQAKIATEEDVIFEIPDGVIENDLVAKNGLDKLRDSIEEKEGKVTAEAVYESLAMQSTYETASLPEFSELTSLFNTVCTELMGSVAASNNPITAHDTLLESMYNWDPQTWTQKEDIRLYISQIILEAAIPVSTYISCKKSDNANEIKKVTDNIKNAGKVFENNTGYHTATGGVYNLLVNKSIALLGLNIQVPKKFGETPEKIEDLIENINALEADVVIPVRTVRPNRTENTWSSRGADYNKKYIEAQARGLLMLGKTNLDPWIAPVNQATYPPDSYQKTSAIDYFTNDLNISVNMSGKRTVMNTAGTAADPEERAELISLGIIDEDYFDPVTETTAIGDPYFIGNYDATNHIGNKSFIYKGKAYKVDVRTLSDGKDEYGGKSYQKAEEKAYPELFGNPAFSDTEFAFLNARAQARGTDAAEELRYSGFENHFKYKGKTADKIALTKSISGSGGVSIKPSEIDGRSFKLGIGTIQYQTGKNSGQPAWFINVSHNGTGNVKYLSSYEYNFDIEGYEMNNKINFFRIGG
jgi:gas vesicle protein